MSIKEKSMMALSRPRLQVVQNDEITKAMATIRKYRPGLINDSMLVTSALVEHALALESEKEHQSVNYATPYGMTIVKTGEISSDVGIFQFFSRNFKSIAGIIVHVDSEQYNHMDHLDYMDYISRGQKPAYTFIMKGNSFTDFEFIHISACESLFEDCLTLLVLDLKHHCDDIKLNIMRANFTENSWGKKSTFGYVPSLNKMANDFFQGDFHLFGGRHHTSAKLDLKWEEDCPDYPGIDIADTRYVNYSHALIGLKESSFRSIQSQYAIETLVGSGVLAVNRDLLHRRFRCMCDGWSEERQDLDLYEIGLIFLKHFGAKAAFSPARILHEITVLENQHNACVYVENGKRIEILPVDWSGNSWFTYRVDGKSSIQGWSILSDEPNPFRLYDMADFHPQDLEAYKQKKKKPK
jgi:hypothetical protein